MPAELHTTLMPDTPVRYLKGVGPKTAERFEKLGIVTLADLLCHYPRRYIDFSKPYSIAEAPADTECVVKAEVFAKPGGRILPGGRRMERITAGDDVSSLEITWFNNPYAAQKLELGQEYYFQGIVTGGMLRRQMVNPQVPFSYHSEEVTFQNADDGVTLAGTLTWPASGGRCKAVVLVSGRGGQDRNNTFSEHKTFFVLADYLARHGIATLSVDDRGVGKYGGNLK